MQAVPLEKSLGTDEISSDYGPQTSSLLPQTKPTDPLEQAVTYGSINDSIKFVEATPTDSSSTEEPTVLYTETQKNAGPPFQTLLVLSLANLLVSTPFNGNQNIQSSINSQGSLGVITLACIYATVLLCAPFASSAIRKLGCKTLLLLHWATNITYMSANFYPEFYTLLPMSIVTGVTASCIGTVQSLYLTAASDNYIARKKLSKDRQHAVLSIFFGVFFSFAEFSQVSGNLISSLVLFTLSSQPGNMTYIKSSVCGASMCPEANMTTTAFTRPSHTTLDILYGIFVSSEFLGFLLTLSLMPKLRVDSHGVKVGREISGCYRVLMDPRYALMIPIIMGQAMTVMVLFTGFTQAFVSCSLGVEWVGFIMMIFGASAGTFATVANYLARYLGRVVLMITFILIDTGLLLTQLMINTDSKLVLITIVAVAGVSEGISQPQFNSIVSMLFRDNLSSAFVAYNMVKCLGFSASLAISSFACLYVRLYLVITLYGLGLIGYIATEILAHKKAVASDRMPRIKDTETQKKADQGDQKPLIKNTGKVVKNMFYKKSSDKVNINYKQENIRET
ncbi:protein unc-93 A [Biomphalaria pfeifferi]|uniref:Protein unc-93 A n=1 Tax=Biomphalaria pfeifferi TaxID=112525 RepID=A0AAD8B7I3_BIOPF|nr:protein unc-93 A [Biomphalaria pfeifferi]